MSIPAEETEETDDSVFALPEYCTMHGSSGTVLNPSSPGFSTTGPGYVPKEDNGIYLPPSYSTSLEDGTAEFEDDVLEVAPPPDN